MGRFFSDKVRKRVAYFGLSLFCISRGKKTKQILLERGKFSFLNVDIWFDVTKCKFIVKNSSFEMLVVFSPIFVADTKIALVYNFVALLRGYYSWKICLFSVSKKACNIFPGGVSCFTVFSVNDAFLDVINLHQNSSNKRSPSDI